MPTILVIDDNPAVATALETLFALHDIQVEHASSPDAGLRRLERGDIDLMGYFKALVDVGYKGPVCLEVIGPDQSYDAACAIASESFGYMNALLKVLGNR